MAKRSRKTTRNTPTHRASTFKKRLQERYRKLLGNTYGLAGYVDDSSKLFGGLPSRIAVDSYDEEVTHQISEMCLGELHDIENALRKLSEGDYGVCEDCGQRIPDARLDAIPSASVCVGCQEKREWRRRAEQSEKSDSACYASLGSAMAQAAMD